MSSLTTDQGIVHYEVYGRGRPVILLHGWLGSWGLWQETMEYLGRYYRTYALDFWGFGESDKDIGTFEVTNFVAQVGQFMDHLGIVRAPLVGHSMGGTTSLSVALEYPERVSKVCVIGSPVNGNSLAFLLKLSGLRPIAILVHNMMWALKLGIKVAAPIITKDPRWPEMIGQDLSQTSVDSFLMSIASLRKTDLTDQVSQLKMPVMGMYGDKDVIVSPKQWQPLQGGVPQAQIIRYPDAGHFIMLDRPALFRENLKGFLDQEVEKPPVVTEEAA